MKSIVKVTNKGPSAQIVRIVGGTKTIKIGKTVDVEDMVELTPAQIEHYRQRGVTFSKGGEKSPAPKDSKKTKDSDANADAIAQAEASVAAAQAAIVAAADDLVAKAAAEESLATAEAALAALQD